MDNSCGSPAAGKALMRVVGAFTTFFAIITAGIDGGVAAYISFPALGPWRYDLVVLSSGLLGMVSNTRGAVIVNCVLSIVAVLLALIGATVEGAYSTITGELSTCYSPKSGDYYGNSAYDITAFSCYNKFQPQSYDCYCTPAVTNYTASLCFPFNGQSDCTNVIGKTSKLHQMLAASAAFGVFMLLSIFTLSVLTCCSLCCPRNLQILGADRYGEEQPQGGFETNTVVVGQAPTVVVVGDSGSTYVASGAAVYGYGGAAPATATVVQPAVMQASPVGVFSTHNRSYENQDVVQGKIVN